ncbi:UPF0223 family protein [Tannockella kyphosi]|uniref:UPF0223 family protein n=1 Tax=Tannockella kyphosi TaxID=2899121 RepID=UPI002010F1A0|nr:UPF0223 family protein [Tannockella kyphosi]
MEYNYPLDYTWSTSEIIDVIAFYNCIEEAYEKGITKESLMKAYRDFKVIVDSKSYEKQIDKEFKEVSGYSIYEVIKKSKETDFIKMV